MKILIILLMLLNITYAKDKIVQHFSVQSVKVKKESFTPHHTNYGYVKADDARKYDVVTRFSGYVVKLHSNKIYQYVKKGELLAEVYSPEVYKAKEEYLNAYNYSLKRSDEGMLQSARLKLALLNIDRGEIDQMVKNQCVDINTKIYAPASGYIFIKNIVNGSAFNANRQLFQIVNLDEIWVETELFEEQLQGLKSVERYVVNFKGLEESYSTKNSLLYPTKNQDSATFKLRLRLKNSKDKIVEGMYASITSFEKRREILALPSTAVIRKKNKHYVFLVGDFKGEYEPFEVDVKRISSERYEVINGLVEGDEVVNNALFMMDSDAQINTLY